MKIINCLELESNPQPSRFQSIINIYNTGMQCRVFLVLVPTPRASGARAGRAARAGAPGDRDGEGGVKSVVQ